MPKKVSRTGADRRYKKINIAETLLKNLDPTGEAALEVSRQALDENNTVMVMDFQ
jgi:hypothetical protein